MEPRTRGIDDATVRIGVIATESAYRGVEAGVRARLERVRRAGGVAGRTVEIVEVIDDGGDPEMTLAAARRLVEEVGVFAVVLASAVPEPAVTDYLESEQTPFFGWGFAPGFCAPNRWGFGFSGCLIGAVTGVEGARVDPSPRLVLEEALGPSPAVALVVDDGPAGAASELTATGLWGPDLDVIVRLGDTAPAGAVTQILDSVTDAALERPIDAVFLSVGLDTTIAVKAGVVEGFAGMVVDDVTYFPGLLADIPTALALEGGFAVSHLPPQEEYREVTGVIAEDLDAVDGPLVYSQAITLGYWSADVLVTFLEAVGADLNNATFSAVVHGAGVAYAPGLAGGPCPISSAAMHVDPAGGAALVQVRGGIYRPVVEFTCPDARED